MHSDIIRILLLESNPEVIRVLPEMLGDTDFELTRAEHLDDALQLLLEKPFDIILLDAAGTAESNRLDWVHAKTPGIPIILLGDVDDSSFAVNAVREGAQDYLVKRDLRRDLLVRSIRYAIERHRLREELRALSLEDELTGLYNRRGFMLLAQQQLKLAHRMKQQLTLTFADLDELKQINDMFGHAEGDAALRQTAQILKQVFRGSDLIARIGGDEFAILGTEANGADGNALVARLAKKLETLNGSKTRGYRLTLSLGIVAYSPEHPKSIEQLLARADELMYSQKGKKRARPGPLGIARISAM